MRRVLFLIFFFYLLALVQATVLVHFSKEGITPNLVLASVILINYFVPRRVLVTPFSRTQWSGGLFASLLGGFFLDIFSCHFFTLSLFSLVFLTLLLEKLLKNLNKFNFLLFILLFAGFSLTYDSFLALEMFFLKTPEGSNSLFPHGVVDYSIFIKMVYNLAPATLGYFLLTKLLGFGPKNPE